jgi:hypothetical protein
MEVLNSSTENTPVFWDMTSSEELAAPIFNVVLYPKRWWWWWEQQQ